jgi:Bacterial PH domain
MPAADLRIHENQLVQATNVDGVSVRNDVLYTNDKGEESAGMRRRSEKTLQKLQPALQRILLPGETVLFAARARSPLSLLEQLTSAWWTAALAACAIVLTNKRILFFPVSRDGSWKESVRAAQWGDIAEINPKGLLIRNVSFKFKNGTRITYTNFRRADARKIAAVAAAALPLASGEMTATHGFVQLCPDCRNALTPGQYSCSACGLIFKNERTMVMRSIFLPGGGYFYTGHRGIGIFLGIVEGYLLLEILLLLFAAGLASPKAMANIRSALILLAFFWAIETGVTILHCRRYIRDFIPEKRDPTRSQQGVAPAIGR